MALPQGMPQSYLPYLPGGFCGQERAIPGTLQACEDRRNGRKTPPPPTYSIMITTHLSRHYVLPIRGEGQRAQRLPEGKEKD